MIVYIIIVAYLILVLAAGFIGYKNKQEQTPDDYFLANRGIGSVIMFFTFIATNFSAFFFLGFAGEGYRTGYAYYAMMAFGTALVALTFYLVGFRVWKLGKANGYVTPAELIGDLSGNKTLEMLYLLVMVFFTLPYMAIQPIGAGKMLETLTGGDIPYFWGASILTFFTVVYVFWGGMRTSAITDMIQGILMFVLMFMAVWVVAKALGGLEVANKKVMAIQPDLFSRQGGGGYFTYQKWFSLMCLWMFCVPMFPQMFMRFYIAKDIRSFKTSTILYALVPLVLFICPVIIGVLGHLTFPGLQGRAADNILPLMLNEHAPQWMSALIMTGALAAFMSTLDSQLLALSTMLTRDFYLARLNKRATFAQQVWWGRILVALLAVLALFIAYQPPSTIFNIAKNSFTGLALLFPATFAYLHYPKTTNPYACIASIITGELLLLGIITGFIPQSFLLGFDAIIPLLLIGGLIVFLGSFRKKKF